MFGVHLSQCGRDSHASSIDASLYRAWGRLAHPLSVLYPCPAVRAAGGNIAADARFLDGVLGRDPLLRLGDDGPAVRPHGALPARHRAVGRGRHLSLSPPDIADSGRASHCAPDYPVRRPAGIGRAAQFHPGTVACPLRRPVDLLAARAGGDGPVAREVEYPLRDLAPLAHPVGGGGHCGWAGAYGGVELLPRRSLEAGAVDWPDDLLDWAAAICAHCQAAVHAPPAVPRLGSTQGTRRYLDFGDAS